MSYSTKNYTEQGGTRTVIGGDLVFEEGARIVFANPSSESQPAQIDLDSINLTEAIENPIDITEYLSEEDFDELSSGEHPVFVKNVACYLQDVQVEKNGETQLYTVQCLTFCQGQCIAGFAVIPGDDLLADANLLTVEIFKSLVSDLPKASVEGVLNPRIMLSARFVGGHILTEDLPPDMIDAENAQKR